MRKSNILNNKINICVVEDDPNFRDTFAYLLERHGQVTQLDTPEKALQEIARSDFDLIFVDMDMYGELVGPKIIEAAVSKGIYTVVVTSYEEEKYISLCLDKGAQDYFVKGEEISLIEDIFSKFYSLTSSKKKRDSAFQSKNPSYQASLDFLYKNIDSDFPVLLQGATGSGKTYLAKKIHEKSQRKGSFVAVNCSAISKNLFESEFFGHVKGSFSGAISNYEGKIAKANGGTLYLDEIDSLSLEGQAKLLKVIEEKEYYQVGSNKLLSSDFRLICSSQKSLIDLIKEGKFREDLYFRISFIQTQIKPLRERKEDILRLFKSFLKGPRKYFITQSFEDEIHKYSWPGNIRELQTFALNIALKKESRLEREIAKQFFNNIDQQDEKLLSHSIIEKFNEVGFEECLNLIRAEIIQYCLKKNNLQVNKTIKELNISSASFYRWKGEV